MASLIYSAIASLDGYVEDERGNFDWAAPDEEVHAFVNDLERPVGTYLYGRPRRLSTPGRFRRCPARDARIEHEFDAAAIKRLKESSRSDITIGGAELAGHAIAEGLVDECHLFLGPVLVGGGKRALPAGVHTELELLDERRFHSGVVYLHCRF